MTQPGAGEAHVKQTALQLAADLCDVDHVSTKLMRDSQLLILMQWVLLQQ